MISLRDQHRKTKSDNQKTLKKTLKRLHYAKFLKSYHFTERK